MNLSGNDCQRKVVSELLSLPDVRGYCPRSIKPARLRNLSHADREKVVKLSCRTWTCPVCAERLKEKAGIHFGTMLLLADGALFEAESPAADWLRDRVRLHRLGASWVRLGVPGGTLIGSTPSPFGVALSDRERAVVRLGEVLRGMAVSSQEGRRARPVNCSKDWTPPARERRYELVGWLRVRRPEQILSRLASLGISAKARPGDGDKEWDVVYQIPPFWGKEERNRLSDLLQSAACNS